MSRSTNAVGLFFMVLGLVVVVAAAAVMIAARSFNIAGAIVLIAGFSAAVLGALFVEPDAAKIALHSLVGEVGPYVPGGRRITDPVQRPPEP